MVLMVKQSQELKSKRDSSAVFEKARRMGRMEMVGGCDILV